MWLGNFRGNTYSRRHVTLDPELEEFWRFSFDENGEQDLPTMLDHVLAITGRQKLVYIGHSMATIAVWIMMNNRPDMNAKVELMVGLAPVAAAVLHPANPLVVGAMVVNKVDPIPPVQAPPHPQAVQLLNLTGQYELLAQDSLISGLKEKLFSTASGRHPSLSTAQGQPGARATPLAAQDLLPTWSINRHAPSGTSSRTLLHWGQAQAHPPLPAPGRHHRPPHRILLPDGGREHSTARGAHATRVPAGQGHLPRPAVLGGGRLAHAARRGGRHRRGAARAHQLSQGEGRRLDFIPL